MTKIEMNGKYKDKLTPNLENFPTTVSKTWHGSKILFTPKYKSV